MPAMTEPDAAQPDPDWARPVVHWVIRAVDPAEQRAFYEALFSWDIEADGLMSIEAGFGGPEPGPAGHIEQAAAPGVTLYVQVRDLAETMARAVELGGAVTQEPFQFPGTPTLAFIADPEGNPLGLVQQ